MKDKSLEQIAKDAAKEYFRITRGKHGDFSYGELFELRDLIYKAITTHTESLKTELEAYKEALIWCSGSSDFSEGGQARDGWLKLCAPLLNGSIPRVLEGSQAELEQLKLDYISQHNKLSDAYAQISTMKPELDMWRKEWADSQVGNDIIFDTPQDMRDFQEMLSTDPIEPVRTYLKNTGEQK